MSKEHDDLYDRYNCEGDREYLSECECCGQMKYGCVDLVYMGMDTHACPSAEERTTNEVVLLIATLALAGCEDSNAKWERERQAGMAKWWERHDKESAETDAALARWAIEDNTRALQELNAKLRRH